MLRISRVVSAALFVPVALGIGCCAPDGSVGLSQSGGRPLPAAEGGAEPVRRAQEADAVDVAPRPVEHIPPGTVIGEEAPRGWSHLALFVKPRLGAGDYKEVSSTVAKYAKMFLLAVLANVSSEQGSHFLDKVAIGFALESRGRNLIATPRQPQGISLGLIGNNVWEENEKQLENVLQVARTRTLCAFDAKAIVLRGQQHQNMIMRHVVSVSPADGKLSVMVYFLTGDYRLAEDEPQLLRPNMQEDRVMNVKRERFNALGIPSPDAFAIVRLPQGTAVRFGPELQRLAATKTFTAETAQRFDAELQKALREAK